MPEDQQTIQAKYESQLPKPRIFDFDRISSAIANIASVAGLIVAPFIIENHDTLSYTYIGFLSFLVIILIIHAILVEKRKLHRYAQTVFHSHFTQHIIRDALSEFETINSFELEKKTELILNSIASCFSLTSGKNCRASIIELKKDFQLKVVARDSMSKIRVLPRKKEHFLEDNTDFKSLWFSTNGCSRYYLNNNIVRSWKDHEYHNSCFREFPDRKGCCKRLLPFVKKWPLNYKSALVLPIRYVSEFSPPQDTKSPLPHWKYYGFLCIDSISKNSFDERYSPEIGGMFADMLYTFLNQSDYILEKRTNFKK